MVKIGIIPTRLLRYRQTKKSRNNLNSAVTALIGRGIRTLPICKIVDFEWVPNNLVTRLARNNDSANPYFFAEEENRHLMVPVFLLAEV